MGCGSSSEAPTFAGDVDEYSWFREKGDELNSGEWRTGLKDKTPDTGMGAASMIFSVKGIMPDTAGGDGEASENLSDKAKSEASKFAKNGAMEGVGMAADALIPGSGMIIGTAELVAVGASAMQGKKEGEAAPAMPKWTLTSKAGQVVFTWELGKLSGLDTSKLKGGKLAGMIITGSAGCYKLVKLKADNMVVALYKSASAEADMAESDLYLTIKSNMMESEWKAYNKNDEIIAELNKGSAMSEPTDPRNFKLVKGSDLPVVFAAYSAMLTWPTEGMMGKGSIMDVAGIAMGAM